ncbi:MAG TPA: hypothetical protein VN436_14195, partial [Holophaga sp.]|nr:hypothetical protein [Holophaga sp.]
AMAERLGALLALALAPAALLAQAEPPSVQVMAGLPTGTRIPLKLVFKKGIQVQSARLPERFVKANPPEGWVPYEGLSPEGKRWALQAAFPDDEWREDGIRHHVRWPELESVWLMASLFSGHGQNYDQLQQANPGKPEKLRKGDVWVIPQALVSVDLGGNSRGVVDRSQPEDDLEDAEKVQAYRALLAYGRTGRASSRSTTSGRARRSTRAWSCATATASTRRT